MTAFKPHRMRKENPFLFTDGSTLSASFFSFLPSLAPQQVGLCSWPKAILRCLDSAMKSSSKKQVVVTLRWDGEWRQWWGVGLRRPQKLVLKEGWRIFWREVGAGVWVTGSMVAGDQRWAFGRVLVIYGKCAHSIRVCYCITDRERLCKQRHRHQ